MKKLYICPQLKWTIVSEEQDMLAGSALGQAVYDESASETADVLSREDNNSFSLWDDEE